MDIKKILAGIAAAALVFTSAQVPLPENGKGLIQLTAHAETVIDSGYCGTELRYWLTDDGVLRIAGNDDMTYHPWDHKKVVKVVIEDGVKSICADAFKNCYYLTSVTIPTSVKSIGVNAFAQTQAYFIQGGIHYISSDHGLYAVGSNTDITTAVFDDNCVLMCDGICTNRTALRSVKLPSSISSVSKNAFNGAGLTEITIPSNVTRIGAYAFKFCIDMTRVTFSEGLVTINTEAFSNCSRLEKITLPKSLSWVDNKAFYDCTSLREVTSLSHDTYYDPDVQSVFGFSSSTDLLRYYYGYFDSELNSLKNFFPIDDSGSQSGFTWSYSAETGALVINGSGDLGTGRDDVPWEDCRDHIKSVTLLGDVTSVEDDFFYNCKNLVTISLPDSMTEMPSLSGCVSLESINIPTGVTALDSGCLKNCSSLTELVLSDNITYIEKDAISGCSSLRSITIPNRECIVYDQKGLPLTLEVICIEGSKAYRWAEENGYTITLYSSDIMGSCGVSYNLNDGILYLSDGKMDDFDDSDPPWKGKEFTEVICENVRYIGRNAFKGCTNIKKITFDTSLAKIGDYAFMDCKELEELNIKTEDAENQWGLEELGDGVFKNCTSLKTFEAPQTLRKYGEELFYGCTSLEAFYFSPEDAYNGWDDSGKAYDDRELAAYMDHARPSVRMFCGCSSLKEIPDVFDGYYNEEAFAYCTSLTSADITSHVDKGTFKGCTSLKYLSFKRNYYVIEESAFENTGLKELKLMESSLYHESCIGNNAFKDCKQLKIVNIPQIIAIDTNAFIGCIALKDINFSGTKADWEQNFGELKFSADVTIHTTGDSNFVVTAPPGSIVTTTGDGGSDPAQGTTTTPVPSGKYSGSCISRIDKPDGDYDEDVMYWAIDNGVLTLGGKGAYLGFSEQPWKRYKDEVKKLSARILPP